MMRLKQFAAEQLGYRLCYVSGNDARCLWFTNSMDEQTGSYWHKAPWWYWAKPPREDGNAKLAMMCLRSEHKANGNYMSVESINSKELPWLLAYDVYPDILAGTTLGHFLNMAAEYGLKVYLEADLLS